MRANRHFRKSLPLFILILLVLLILAGFCVIKHHTSNEAITPTPTTSIDTEQTVFFYQKDDAWKDDALGDSAFHMRDSGCLVSCLAAAFQMQNLTPTDFPDEMTPGTLNAYLSDNHAYDSEGNLQWTVLEEIAGVHIAMHDATDINASDLENLLTDGVYPIVRVRVNGVGSWHYVLIAGCDIEDFWCMDPLEETKTLIPLSDFGGKIYAVRYLQIPNRLSNS